MQESCKKNLLSNIYCLIRNYVNMYLKGCYDYQLSSV